MGKAMPDLSFTALAAILTGVAALLALAGGLRLPRSYWEHKAARDEIRKQRLQEKILREHAHALQLSDPADEKPEHAGSGDSPD